MTIALGLLCLTCSISHASVLCIAVVTTLTIPYCALLSHKVVNLDTAACIETGQSSALWSQSPETTATILYMQKQYYRGCSALIIVLSCE